MTTPIEAQSLSSLTNLFANPPQYPRNPTHQVHEPLTLYIVRVPGSRDVFLSPVKPPTKASIGVEAVQNSLYYLHVNSEEDEIIQKSYEDKRRSEESARPSINIARKPLPQNSTVPHPLPPLPHESSLQHGSRYSLSSETNSGYHQEEERGARQPLHASTNTGFGQWPHTLNQPSTVYNPAGDYALSPLGNEAYHETFPPRLPPGGSFAHAQDQLHTPPNELQAGERRRSSATSQHVPHQVDSKFPTITVIRRDPSSEAQWNIGTINVLRSTFTGSNVKPVCVELNTPGYGRFARPDFDMSRPVSAGTDAASVRRAMESATITPASPSSPDTPTTHFTRIVDFKKMALADLKRTVYQRTNSFDSIGRIDPSKSGIEKNVLAFDSPWHGTCTFVNAIDGKTLKIKHTISSNVPASEGLTANIGELRFNLGWSILSNIKENRRKRDPEPDKLPIPQLLDNKKQKFRRSIQQLKQKSRETLQRSRRSSQDDDDVLKDISNIQTPTSNNINDNAYLRASTPDNTFHPPNDYPYTHSSAHPTSSEDNEDEQHRLSLRLGRERAGGGFRGHSAKLGKLIIEDEGLKMCDLVVGAAMGVWWQHYGG